MSQSIMRSIVAALFSAALFMGLSVSALAAVPAIPAVTPVVGASQPYGSNDLGVSEMARLGYVQEEYFISGKIGDGLAYTTRLLVRRPTDAKKFSGIVIAESIRSSGIRSMWMEAPYMMRHGDAYVEIGSNLSINTIVRPSDPVRYATLNVPNPNQGPLVFGHVQEIVAQAGLLLRSNLPNGPFPGLKVRHVLLAGCSEQGMFVRLYMRDSHHLYRTADGHSIFDGYFPACVGDWPPVVATAVGGPFPNFTQPPVEVPVILLTTSEPEAYSQDGRLYRRPDSDAADDKFRLYEVAAMPHGLDFRAMLEGPPYAGMKITCNGVSYPISRFPGAYPANNALDKLIRWVDRGTPPPRASRLETESAKGPVIMDEFGNPKGGVRTTAVDVPTAQYPLCHTGKVTDIEPVGITFAPNYEIPFTPKQLKALYPTPQAYIAKVNRRLDELVREGWYLKEDADQARAQATAFAKTLVAAASAVPSVSTSSMAQTSPAPAAQSDYATASTDIGTLLDNPALKEIVDKHIPGILSGDQISMARSMTLKAIQQYAPDKISDQALADIDAEFAKLPAEK
jgi:Alpha/beta hydrolase domain